MSQFPTFGLIQLFAGDPSIAPGVSGLPNQFLLRTDNNSLYYKSGTADTAWSVLSASSAGSFSGASVYNSVDQLINNNTVINPTFDSENFDVGGYHDPAVNPGRLTPPSTGYYEVGLIGGFQSNAGGRRSASIRKNSGGNPAGGSLVAIFQCAPANGDISVIQCGSIVLNTVAGDYFEAFAFQNSGANINFLGATQYAFFINRVGV